MPDKPLLIFPTPTKIGRSKKSFPPSSFRYPSPDRQSNRLTPKFENIEQTFEARRAELIAQPTGAVFEQVLVLETVGTVADFITAVRSIPGMEWLGEWDEEDIPPDEDFYADEKHRDKVLNGRLYLVITNQTAIAELLSMWGKYKADPAVVLERGRAKWKDLFHHLREIRQWGIEDRLKKTGILDDWEMRATRGMQIVRFEIELWYKENESAQHHTAEVIKNLLIDKGGRLIKQGVIKEIAYHSILAELPINAIKEIIDNPVTQLVRCDQVMFFRPSGQAAVAVPQDDPLPGSALPTAQLPVGTPVVALLDGLPLENHNLLSGRLIVDDPDNWSQTYPAHERHHGTAMASLIIHDELDAGAPPMGRPLYVRPILKPDYRNWQGPVELVPEDELAVDLVHRAVKRIFEGDGGEPATAPTVRIINLSVCDPSRPLTQYLSPWARLLDWLAWKYNVLFVVSAGNKLDDIELSIRREALSTVNGEELEALVVRSVFANGVHSRLLSPAESINSLTIAGAHDDSSPAGTTGNLINPYVSPHMPSPINSLGLGFRRSIKPDALFKSGKQLYLEKMGTMHDSATLQISESTRATGQSIASPGRQPGYLSATRYSRGTSNAAALTSRIAAQLYAVLDNLRQAGAGAAISEQYMPVLLKALSIHSASWGDTHDVLEKLLKPISKKGKVRENIHRFLGYGYIAPERVYSCTDQRATLIGYGSIGCDDGHIYSVPLPPSLSGQRIWRRLTITLAWFSPINSSHRSYRKAALSFDPREEQLEKLLVEREEADFRAAKRGTVQHEILEGKKASIFVENDLFQFQVNCRADAGELTDTVRYAVVATLEVAEDIEISIYNEIRTRIRPAVPVIPT
ncbi:MAG: S8 family peptidase [Nitrospirae bacterium]|nr:S8 family peptidase [Nitrospirota bacterium]